MGPHNQSEGVHVPCADVINLVGLDSYDASSAVASKHWVAPVSVDHTSREGTSYKVDRNNQIHCHVVSINPLPQ